ncbi:hypothetical protein LCGC14_1363440 [marine sediment metagenome]|uniref:Uncharacterized protein n=1 Tax=marine sediment metagenome TaxID=412755 RepID=A0A0F9K7X1_9ZZZZ
MTQSIINVTNFSLDKMFDNIYPLEVVNKIFKKLDKNWKSQLIKMTIFKFKFLNFLS